VEAKPVSGEVVILIKKEHTIPEAAHETLGTFMEKLTSASRPVDV
jgi:hypothetical protein